MVGDALCLTIETVPIVRQVWQGTKCPLLSA